MVQNFLWQKGSALMGTHPSLELCHVENKIILLLPILLKPNTPYYLVFIFQKNQQFIFFSLPYLYVLMPEDSFQVNLL